MAKCACCILSRGCPPLLVIGGGAASVLDEEERQVLLGLALEVEAGMNRSEVPGSPATSWIEPVHQEGRNVSSPPTAS